MLSRADAASRPAPLGDDVGQSDADLEGNEEADDDVSWTEGGLDQRSPGQETCDRYFALAGEIESARGAGDYDAAAVAVRASIPLLQPLVAEWTRDFRRFDIQRSVAVDPGATVLAIVEDRDGLAALRRALASVSELRMWLPVVEQAESDIRLVPAIVSAVSTAPGMRQTDLKRSTGASDGRRTSALAAWLEKAGRLVRIKDGTTYRLYLPDAAPRGGIGRTGRTGNSQDTAAPRTALGSAASSDAGPATSRTVRLTIAKHEPRPAKRPRTVDLAALPYVRLPQAPRPGAATGDADNEQNDAHDSRNRRDATTSRDMVRAPSAADRFAVDGEGWRLTILEKLAPADRPDPTFRQAFHAPGVTWSLDPKGKRVGFEEARAVLRVAGEDGGVVAEAGLPLDVYRADLNGDGSGIVCLSRDGVLHGYDRDLNGLVAERLAELPEYRAAAERLQITADELRTHVRCVSLSRDRTRVLVTVVDEAWVCSIQGDALWGLRMPTAEGWTRVASPRSAAVGTDAELRAALDLMTLTLPVAPDDVTRQYRKLAMQWHPDRNAGDPLAGRRMQQLNAAMELLTGVDVSQFAAPDLERITYERILSTSWVQASRGLGVSVSLALMGSEKTAADWIYAADFAAATNRAFVATYGGKVLVIREDGTPERVYDIGAVPRRIVEMGEHLYLLTDTRLYVLHGNELVAFVDTAARGDLLVTDNGFGLLESHHLTWFTPTGARVGSIATKDPLRRVFWSGDILVAETRQYRVRVVGAPRWWR